MDLETTMDLTMRQFSIMLKQMGIIMGMENGTGDSQPRMTTSEQQHKMAMRMFGGKGKK
jgi:hypothetical protein